MNVKVADALWWPSTVDMVGNRMRRALRDSVANVQGQRTRVYPALKASRINMSERGTDILSVLFFIENSREVISPTPCVALPTQSPALASEGAAIFVTWCLHGIRSRRCSNSTHVEPGRAFAHFDRALNAAAGPRWLGETAVAQCVVDALHFGERHLQLYALIAFCVMPNHVHVVVEPHAPMARITKSIKGFTARRANTILGRTGERFWQDESYDHWIRNAEERNRIVRYTECNPVAAGMVETPEEWRWSSASKR